MSKYRLTFETLTAGQPRPYADSIYRTRVLVEWQGTAGFKDKNAPFVPADMVSDTLVKQWCKAYRGWTPEGEGNWADDRLVAFQKVGPGEWEWTTRAAYTD